MNQNIGICLQHQNQQLCYICLDIDCNLPEIRFCVECREMGVHTHNEKENFYSYPIFCYELKLKELVLKEELLQATLYKSIISNQILELQEYLSYVNQLAQSRENKLAQYVGISNLPEQQQLMDLSEDKARYGKQFLLMPFLGDFDGLYRNLGEIIQRIHTRVVHQQGDRIRQGIFGFYSDSVVQIKQRNYQQQKIQIQIGTPERIELSLNQQFIIIICLDFIHFYSIGQNQILQQLQIDYQCSICYFDELYNHQYGVVILGSTTGSLNIYNYSQDVIIFKYQFNKIKFQPIYIFKPATDSQIIKVLRLNRIYDINPSQMTEKSTCIVPQKGGSIQHTSVDFQIRQCLLGLILDEECIIFNYMDGIRIYHISFKQREKYCIKFSQETDQMTLGCGLKGDIFIYQIDVVKNKKPQLKCKIQNILNL
ncbi:hypothetical protein pb186bvf_009746 [Paramecium bursaria]